MNENGNYYPHWLVIRFQDKPARNPQRSLEIQLAVCFAEFVWLLHLVTGYLKSMEPSQEHWILLAFGHYQSYQEF